MWFQRDPKGSQVIQSVLKWTQVHPNEHKQTKMNLREPKYPSESHCTQVNLNEPKWTQVSPSELKWAQVNPIKPKVRSGLFALDI